MAKTDGMRYIGNGVPRKVPEGRVLVHNRVSHGPRTPVGVRGFRAWTQPVDADDPPVVECDCGWAAGAGVHYRVDLDRVAPGPGEPPS